MDQKGIFVRYRRGTLLNVLPNVVESFGHVGILLSKGQEPKDEIKQIADGMGWGIAVDSTWLQMGQECVDEFRRDFPKTEAQWRPLLQQFFSIIAKDVVGKTIWEELRAFLHRNVDVLSGWVVSPTRGFSTFQKVQRSQGEYFYEDDGEKIQIIGARTAVEERADFIANDGTHSYGRLNVFFHLFAISNLGRAFKEDPKQFPSSVKVILSEGDSWTSFLNWRWSIEWPYQMRTSTWRPNDNYCDPVWLANDFIAFMSEKESLFITDGHISKEPELHERWHAVFGKTKWQTAFALDSSLRLDNEEEVWIEFRGHTYRWINQNESIHPTVVATHDLGESDDSVQLRTFRFLSQIAYRFDQGIEIKFWAGSASSMNRLAVNPKRAGAMQNPSRVFEEFRGKDSNELDLVLSFYREGISSNSEYYALLSFYKVIQRAFKGPQNALIQWLETHAPKMRSYASIKDRLSKFSGGIEEYLRQANRNALAHAFLGKKHVIDPDDVGDQRGVREALRLVHELARHAIESGLF